MLKALNIIFKKAPQGSPAESQENFSKGAVKGEPIHFALLEPRESVTRNKIRERESQRLLLIFTGMAK